MYDEDLEEELHPKEHAIKLRRTNEAILRDYLGPSGKLGTILKYLGTPIIRQGSALHSERYLDDPYEGSQEGVIPTFDESNSYVEDGRERPYTGYLFDGLSRGMHLEIKYMSQEKKLVVDYKGYNVYTEIAGDLYKFAPFKEWEDLITVLYKQAEKKKEIVVEQRKVEVVRTMKREQAGVLERLRMYWGL